MAFTDLVKHIFHSRPGQRLVFCLPDVQKVLQIIVIGVKDTVLIEHAFKALYDLTVPQVNLSRQ